MGASSEEDEDDSGGSLSDSEFNTESTEAEQSVRYGQPRHGRESNHYDSEDVTQPSHFAETQRNCGNNRKLILRIPRRDLKIQLSSESGNTEPSNEEKAVASLAAAKREAAEPELAFELGSSSACKAELSADGYQTTISGLHNVSAVHSNSTIKWGEVKLRSSKRCKFGDSSGDMRPSSNNALSQGLDESGSENTRHEYGNGIQQMVEQNVQISQHALLGSIHENHITDGYSEVSLPGEERLTNNNSTHVVEENNKEGNQQFHGTQPISFKLKLSRSRGFADEASSSDKSKTTAVGSDTNSEHDKVSMQHDEPSATNQHRSSDFTSVSRSFQERTDNGTCLHDSEKLHFESAKKYSAVYTRSKPSKYRKTMDPDAYGNGDSTSISNDGGYQPPPDYNPATPTGTLRRSARRSSAYTDDARGRDATFHEKNSFHEASTSGRRIAPNVRETWGSTSTAAGLRSVRYKKESRNFPDTHLFEKKHKVSKCPWLMLLEHEDIDRYIPQLGDEVMYLRQVTLFCFILCRKHSDNFGANIIYEVNFLCAFIVQGHEDYLHGTLSSGKCPWNLIKGLKAAELCKINVLDYKSYSGSGESCCKLIMEIIDRTSSGYGEEFEITLPELVSFPDFLVERTRFESAITQNWVIRDKCKVWWTDDLEERGGSWWEGQVSEIRPKSPDFPESPWERYVIQYRNDGSEHSHSPWELHHAASSLAPWKYPHIDPIVRNKLLSAVTDLQEISHTNQVELIYFGYLQSLATLLLLF
jgi:PH-interacting protein